MKLAPPRHVGQSARVGSGELNPSSEPILTVAEVTEAFMSLAPRSQSETPIVVAGEVRRARGSGDLKIVQIFDGTGYLQLFVSQEQSGDEAFAAAEAISVGDLLRAEGMPMMTMRGVLMVTVTALVRSS